MVVIKNKPIEDGNIAIESYNLLKHRLLLYAFNRLDNRIGRLCPFVKYETALELDKWGRTSYSSTMIEARGSIIKEYVERSLSFYWYYYFKTGFPVRT